MLLTSCFLLLASPTHAAMPHSANYQLQEYGFGAGGTASSSSQHYSVNGIAGEVEYGRPASANYQTGSGLTYMMQAPVPVMPTLTNSGNTYDRLGLIINQGSDPADATYAVEVSTDQNFATNIDYVKSDNTLGPSLTYADFRNLTSWGGGTGITITGLLRNTTYYARVKAVQGAYTESGWGIASQSATVDPSITFSVDSSTLTFDNLNTGNSFTDNTKSTVLTTSTNAYNGYVVNARETGALSASGIGTIADYTSPNLSPTTWSGLGFGYTTNDTSLTNGSSSDNRFANGTKYAGFTTSSPGDPVADHPGPVTTAISNEQFTITYRVTTSSTQPAAKYSTTVLYMVVPSY